MLDEDADDAAAEATEAHLMFCMRVLLNIRTAAWRAVGQHPTLVKQQVSARGVVHRRMAVEGGAPGNAPPAHGPPPRVACAWENGTHRPKGRSRCSAASAARSRWTAGPSA